MNAPFSLRQRKGDQGLAPTRPAPRTEGWYRSQAEREYRNMPEGPLKRANIADFIAAAREIDRHYIKNARI